MKIWRFVLPLALLLGGLLALVAPQVKLDLGQFADNPQRLKLPLGARAIIGGGRASLDFVQLSGQRATLVVRCAAGETTLRVEPRQTSDEICGVRIRWLDLLNGRDESGPRQAEIEVSWDQPAAAGTNSTEPEAPPAPEP